MDISVEPTSESTTKSVDALSVRERQDYERALSLDRVTGERRCPAERLFDIGTDKLQRTLHPRARDLKRDFCLEAVPCTPSESCVGSNQCNVGYNYQKKKCELAVVDKQLNLQNNCSVSLQCRTRSYGKGCGEAIASICKCPRENERGSYSCLKNCVRTLAGELERNGCPAQIDMASILAGKECQSSNPEDCSTCVINNNSTTLETSGTCACVASTRCALCTAQEYYRIDGKCETCPSNPELIIIGFIVGVIFVSIGCYVLDRRNFNLAFISIGVDYFQVLAIFASVDIRWPTAIKSIFRLLSFFNLDLDIAAPECILPEFSYEYKFYGTLLLPPFCGLFLLLTLACFTCYDKTFRNVKSSDKYASSRAIGSFLLILYYSYLMGK